MEDDVSRRRQELLAELQSARAQVAALEAELRSLDPDAPAPEQEAGHYLQEELYRLVRTDAAIFDFLQSGSLDGIWYWDLEHPEHEWMSPEFWELFGYAPEEKRHLASEWQDMIFAEDLKLALRNLQQHCENPGHPYSQVVRYRHKDGSTVWVRCRGLAIRDASGRPVRMLGAHNDLTELKRAEEGLRLVAARYRQLVENVSSVILELDSQGRVSFANRHCEVVLGFSRDELLGRDVIGLIVPRIESTGRNLQELLRHVVTNPEQYGNHENEVLCKDGSRRWMHWSNTALRDEAGEVVGVLGVGTDITRRKTAERALQLSMDRFRLLVENMPVMIHAHDAEHTLVFWNRESERVLGYTSKEMVGNPDALKLIYPDIGYRRYVTMQLHESSEEFRDVELLMRAKDGREVVVSWTNVSPSCPVPGWATWAVGRDITARKQAQVALQQSEAKYRLLADNAADVIWTMDAAHRLTYVSPAVERLVGFSLEEYVQMPLAERYTPESCELVRQRIARRQNNWRSGVRDLAPSTVEVEHYTKSGGTIWVEIISRPVTDELGVISGIVGVARDVTRRRRVTEALKQSEARYRTLFEKSSEGVLLHDLQGNILEANQAALDMFGYTMEELRGLHPGALVHPDEAESVRQDFQAIKRDEFTRAEHRCLRKDGTELLAIVSGKKVSRDLIQGVVRDVTAQRKQQQRLRLLNRAMEQSAEAIVITDAQGDIVYVNPHFTAMTGYAAEEALGRNPRLLNSGHHSRTFYENLWQTITGGKTWTGEMCNRRKDGELYWERASISPVQDGQGRIAHFVAVKRDITEQKRLEQIKEDVERIIRHDLKAPLAGIISMPELLLASDTLPDEMRDPLKMIRKSGQQMLALINSSLTLYQIETGDYLLRQAPLNCGEALAGVFAECRDVAVFKELQLQCLLHGKPVDLAELESREEPVVLVCDVELMPFVFSNLVKNAVEAAPFCSRVSVDLQPGDPFCIAVHNAGRVPSAIEDRFFEKYATHGKSHGTGLGTYSARLVARAHGGDVVMRSSETEGTTVTICIPQGVDDLQD